ncbi:MAG TPA: PAS domain S-box protein [Trichocoleus sp.]|jgi:PAS domain S-box-containing protein
MKLLRSPQTTPLLSSAFYVRSSQQIETEIQEVLGFLPPFFMAAMGNSQVLESLWQQTLHQYIFNPLPDIFKEKLSAYLSRFCAIPYCMICHSCQLYSLGIHAKEILELLTALPPTDLAIEYYLKVLETLDDEILDLDQLEPEIETSLLACATFLALTSQQVERCNSALKRVLGTVNYQHLVAFIAFVKTCHVWVEAHPEICYKADYRVQQHFGRLVEENPDLADFFTHYWEQVQYDRQTWLEQQATIAERSRNEAVFRQVTDKNRCLAHALASMSEGVFVTDPNQTDNPIIYSNVAFSRSTEYPPEEVAGRNFQFLWGAATDRAVLDQIHQAIEARREIKATLLSYRKSGQPFWSELRITPVFSETSDLLYYVAIQTDITERKRAEEALRHSESTLRSFFNSASMMMGIVELREDDVLHISGNAATAQYFGIPSELMKNRLVSQMGVPEFYRKQWIQHYREAARTRCPVRFEYTREMPQGTVWLYVTVTAIADDEAQPLRFAYIAEDITERKQAEQKIREQAALLNIATDAIVVRDLNYKVLFWNRGAERLYGWQAEEVLGKKSLDLLYPKSHSQVNEALAIVMEQGEWQGELSMVTKAGKPSVVSSRWTLVRDEAQQPKSILVVDTDISEKKLLETQFLRAQRMESIGTLAGGIAHDLNNVLTPILSSAQLLLIQTDDKNTKQQRLLEMIQTNAKRGANLIKQVLSFARGVEGKHIALQARHLISEIRQIAQETFPKSIDLHIDLASNLWLVSGDATQLHQVLMNLCVNARDAMSKGGTLSICATNVWIDDHYKQMNFDAQPGAYVMISVSDTGTGIPPEVVDRIFEPFFTTKEMGKGTGLGLSTVLGIVRGHGGFVEVNSTLGQGTEFKVYLPAVKAEEPQISLEQELVLGQGELILVVDDEKMIREVSQATLEAYNYQVLTAADGIEAIALYAEHKSDIRLAIVDLMMPVMDGETTIHTLKKIDPQVKIIAVSGLMVSSQIAGTIGKEIYVFLNKPYSAKELVKAIQGVL